MEILKLYKHSTWQYWYQPDYHVQTCEQPHCDAVVVDSQPLVFTFRCSVHSPGCKDDTVLQLAALTKSAMSWHTKKSSNLSDKKVLKKEQSRAEQSKTKAQQPKTNLMWDGAKRNNSSTNSCYLINKMKPPNVPLSGFNPWQMMLGTIAMATGPTGRWFTVTGDETKDAFFLLPAVLKR